MGSTCSGKLPEVEVFLPDFPEELGPFAVVETPFKSEDFRIIPNRFGAPPKPPLMGEDNEGIQWSMEKEIAVAKGLDIGQRFRLEGVFSPRHQVTLWPGAKRALRISEDARTFVFAYPVNDWTEIRYTEMTPAQSFLTIGGFVYLDKEYKILGANTLMAPGHTWPHPALANEKMLCFHKGERWRGEWSETLLRQKRFQPVTIKAMTDAGAHYFCWLRPDEFGFDSPKVPHGGFVYLFDEELGKPHQKDCYFLVKARDNEAEYAEWRCLWPDSPRPEVPFTVEDRKERCEVSESNHMCDDSLANNGPQPVEED